MMEHHTISWLKRWHIPYGFMGEQGAESIHASINGIKRTYSGIPRPVDRLLSVMKEHHLRVEPQNIYLQPQVQRKKRKAEEE